MNTNYPNNTNNSVHMNINKKNSFNSFNYFPTVSGPSANLVFKKKSCFSCERSARTKIREICEIRVQNKKDPCANKKYSFNS